MRYLSLGEVIDLHEAVLGQTGGATGVRDLAAALGYSLTLNHPFIDGNKRVAHAAMEVFLMLNGVELLGTVDEHEQLMLNLAAGQITREQLTGWLEQRAKQAAN